MRIGVFDSPCAQNFDKLYEYKKSGFDYMEANFYNFSNLDSEEFEKVLKYSRFIGLPIEYANCLFGSLRIFDENNRISEDIKEYIKRNFEKFSQTDIKNIGFGSGSSRKTDGLFSAEEAHKRIAEFLAETVLPLAEQYGYQFFLEPLNRSETDVFVTLDETYDFIKKNDLKNVGILTDYYHFMKENESLHKIELYKDYITHSHIASISTRSAPEPSDGEEKSYLEFIDQVRRSTKDSAALTIETWNAFDSKDSANYLKYLTK